jgi:hypothetical protein
MRLEIKNGEKVVLITFDTQGNKFTSNYERNLFFRGLYGWKQIICKDKKYCYRREGLLDQIPHVKISDSVFLVEMENIKKIMDYFNEWHKKVRVEMLEMIINEKKWKEILKKENRINIDMR